MHILIAQADIPYDRPVKMVVASVAKKLADAAR